jgi:hypothetical protein
MTKVLGSLQQVWKQPGIYKTAADAAVVQIEDPRRRNIFRYKYQKRHEAAMNKFDRPMRSGAWAGYTPRQMFAETRNQPFRQGVVNLPTNLKNCKTKGMLSRSSANLNIAYRNKHVQPVGRSAIELKACKTPVQRRVAARRRVQFAAPRSAPRSASSTFHIWDHFTHAGSGGVCANGMEKLIVQCKYCGAQMAYCSRDGPGNHKAHLKTAGCLAHQGRSAVQPASRQSFCATKVKTQCKPPCLWKQGPQRKFCSKSNGRRRSRSRVVAPQPPMVAPQPAMVAPRKKSKRRSRVVAPQPAMVAPQPAMVAPRKKSKRKSRVVAPRPAMVAPQPPMIASQPKRKRKSASKNIVAPQFAAQFPAPSVVAPAPRKRRAKKSRPAPLALTLAAPAPPRKRVSKSRPAKSRPSRGGPCSGKSRADCVAPCDWNNGPHRQFCTMRARTGRRALQVRSSQTAADDTDCETLYRSQNIRTKADWKNWQRQNHPDKGGDPELAKAVNACKNILI